MRWPANDLGRRGRKAAALTLTLSLLNQQGLLISEAAAQVVTGRVTGGTAVAPVVPVAPAVSAPTLSPIASSPLSLTPTLLLPLPAAPKVGAVAAHAAPAAALAPVAAASVAQAASPSLTLPSPASGRGEKIGEEKGEGRGEMVVKELRAVGGELAKGRAHAAPALSLYFDGARRAAGNAVEPAAGPQGSLRSASAAQNGLKAPEPSLAPAEAKVPAPTVGRKFFEFNVQYLKDIKKLFAESATKPNKQDYMFLVTKTFGLNLAVRVAFAIKGVTSGDLGLTRAIVSTAWYQLQDAFFTVFGQTYMKFLGKMTGMLRIGNAKLGDLLFVYVQLVASEFMNRLVLGPIGENPLVYSAGGIGLLLLNNLQGMVSGGLLIPVINKMRAAGLISEKTSNYLYQAASLTMHLGLLATFGYQGLFTVLTTVLMVLSWTAYIGLSFFAKPKPGLEPKL
ncbi:hypothetical protein EPO15_07020 [bacterium]|nr:MAG: hypothetical protein EPO15_07020 [bacterium]